MQVNVNPKWVILHLHLVSRNLIKELQKEVKAEVLLWLWLVEEEVVDIDVIDVKLYILKQLKEL
jgi:hypothetical protein